MGYTDEDEERQLEKMRKRQERYWVHEFMPSRCPDCRNTFATVANLKRHLKMNKSCKEYREKKMERILNLPSEKKDTVG
jgi:predicted anti-sigma-YlaC factor YlaD